MREQEVSPSKQRQETTVKISRLTIAVPLLLAIGSLLSGGYGYYVTQQAEKETAENYLSVEDLTPERQQITTLADELLQLADPEDATVIRPDLQKHQTAVDYLAKEKEDRVEKKKSSSKLANEKGRKRFYEVAGTLGGLAVATLVVCFFVEERRNNLLSQKLERE